MTVIICKVIVPRQFLLCCDDSVRRITEPPAALALFE